MDLLGLLQWPAMLFTVAASWWVSSSQKRKRKLGFWLFLASNALWVAWGWHTEAYALVTLQFCLAALNIRGARKSGQS